jgi:hypothetical protein
MPDEPDGLARLMSLLEAKVRRHPHKQDFIDRLTILLAATSNPGGGDPLGACWVDGYCYETTQGDCKGLQGFWGGPYSLCPLKPTTSTKKPKSD